MADNEARSPAKEPTGNWVLFCLIGFTVLVFVAIFIGDQRSRQQVQAEYPAPAEQSGPPGLASHFTKAQFVSEVQDKTKDQIKAEFGSPGKVWDDTDTWLYFNVDVRDNVAGTRVGSAAIRFEGLGGGSDRAVDVSFD